MRPQSIIWFERLYLFALAIDMIAILYDIRWALGEKDLELAMAEIGFYPDWTIAITPLAFGISLALWYFVARRGSKIAKWIAVTFAMAMTVLLPILFLLDALEEPSNTDIALAICITFIHLIAVMFLFKQDAREWLDSHNPRREAGENL